MVAVPFRFEESPNLPGDDRVSKYGFGVVRRLVYRLWDITVEGAENIPLDGPAIITPNHLSFCDSVFVPAALPRRVWAIGKGEYMDDWKTKHLFPAMGMIPVDRSGGDAAAAPQRRARARVPQRRRRPRRWALRRRQARRSCPWREPALRPTGPTPGRKKRGGAQAHRPFCR